MNKNSKKLKILFSLLVFVMVVILTSCSISRDHVIDILPVVGDHPLVGIWDREDAYNFLYIFNADGAGSRGFSLQASWFNWSITEGGYLALQIGRGTTEYHDFEINDDILTLTNREDSTIQRTYIRVISNSVGVEYR